MSERARALIASGTRWLTASEVARLALVDDEVVGQWVREAKLFSIEQDAGAVLPEYAFDVNWRPLPALESILAIQEGRGHLERLSKQAATKTRDRIHIAFQGSRWLGDVAPHVLTADQRALLPLATARARQRRAGKRQPRIYAAAVRL